MDFHLYSDLHLEFHADGGREFLRTLALDGVVVLAGDVGTVAGGSLQYAVRWICRRAGHVLFVNGNHELYGSTPERVERILRQLEVDCPNFTWLQHKTVEVDGVRFAGTTLWFPETKTERLVNDFNLIRGFEPWVYEEYARGLKFLSEEGPKADVVVTHHVPASRCIAPWFRGDAANHFFAVDLEAEIRAWKPKVWCFGHSHATWNTVVGETRLVANPLGYPHEQGGRGLRFDPELVVEVR